MLTGVRYVRPLFRPRCTMTPNAGTYLAAGARTRLRTALLKRVIGLGIGIERVRELFPRVRNYPRRRYSAGVRRHAGRTPPRTERHAPEDPGIRASAVREGGVRARDAAGHRAGGRRGPAADHSLLRLQARALPRGDGAAGRSVAVRRGRHGARDRWPRRATGAPVGGALGLAGGPAPRRLAPLSDHQRRCGEDGPRGLRPRGVAAARALAEARRRGPAGELLGEPALRHRGRPLRPPAAARGGDGSRRDRALDRADDPAVPARQARRQQGTDILSLTQIINAR